MVSLLTHFLYWLLILTIIAALQESHRIDLNRAIASEKENCSKHLSSLATKLSTKLPTKLPTKR